MSKTNGNGSGEAGYGDAHMADGPAGTTAGHNVAARRERIQKGFGEIYDIEREVERLTEEHIAPLKARRTKAWRNLKGDVDIERKYLTPDYKKFKLLRDARQDDEDGGDAVADKIRESTQALNPGEVVDFVAILQGVEPAAKQAAEAADSEGDTAEAEAAEQGPVRPAA